MTNYMSTSTSPSQNRIYESETNDAGERTAVRDIAEAGVSDVSRVGEEVKSQTSHLVNEAGVKARDRAETQLGRVAGILGQVGDELSRMADGASSRDSYVAVLARDGADVVRRISTRLEQDGLDGATQDVKQFARRRPLMYLAGAAAAGLAIGRLTRNIDPSRVVSQGGSTNTSSGVSAGQPRMPVRPAADSVAAFAEPVL